MAVIVGSVEPFTGLDPDKAQALKPLEEAAEVFGAWQTYERMVGKEGIVFCDREDVHDRFKRELANDICDEIADTIQACVNLAAALGCEDLTPYMEACEERNRKRVRYENKR